MNHANNAAFPKSKQSNAAKPNPIKTTFGISAFSRSSAGKTSLPLSKQREKEKEREREREQKKKKRKRVQKSI